MTITTHLNPKGGLKHAEEEFSRSPQSSQLETALTLAAGAAISLYGLLRRDWFGAAFAGGGGYLMYRGVSDLGRPYQGQVRVACTIAKEPEEVYEFVRNAKNWTSGLRIVSFAHLSEGGISIRCGERGKFVFNSRLEVTDEKPGEYVAWTSDGQRIKHRGVLRLKRAPGDRGTELSVAMEYQAATGQISRSLALLGGLDPEQLVREGLRQIKQLLEAGEIPTTAGQPVGKRGLKGVAKRLLFREHPTVDMQPQRMAGD